MTSEFEGRPGIEQEAGKIDRSEFPYKPKLFSVEEALDTGSVVFRRNGYAVIKKPEITGKERLVIPPERQFLGLIRNTYDDLYKVSSAVSNSPRLSNDKSLQEIASRELVNYEDALSSALGEGLPLAKKGNFLYDSRYQILCVVADEQTNFFALRTSNSLYEDPQERPLFEIWNLFRNSRIGFAGVSVGGNAMEGVLRNIGPKGIKLADPDFYTAGNISRTNRGNLTYLVDPRSERGDIADPYSERRPNKAVMAAREVLLVDPYCNVEVFMEGVDESNIDEFLEGLDVIVEAVDDLATKLLLRRKAKEKGIVYLMPSDVDRRVFVDFYDYRNNPDLPLVHGISDDKVEEVIYRARHGTRPEMVKSFKVLVGNKISNGPFGNWLVGLGEHATASIPQHGATALGTGYVVADVIADYLLGKDVPKRFHIDTRRVVRK